MDSSGAAFHIYYRMSGTAGVPSPRDHIVKDGEALCDYGVSVPDVDSLKPISGVSHPEWVVHLSNYSNLCGECTKRADYDGLIPDDLPEESPEFRCPFCEEPADSVELINDTALIHHKSDSPSGHRSSVTHKIPRERYDMWRTNPEEPFSYSKLKEFIDNYPRVFRPQEYRQAKREEYFRNKD